MYKGKKIGVVVPAYNEEKLISKVIETMPDFVDRIIVVDDKSKDETIAKVKKFGEELTGRLTLIEHKENRGVGGAIVSGYEKAIEEEMDIIVVMAGDAQMDPEEISLLVEPIINDETDYAKGNRLFSGQAWQLIPRYRYLGNAFLSLLTKIASGYWHVADSQAGYTAISLSALRMLQLHKLYPKYGFPNHILVELNIYHLRVKDIPIRPIYNIGEQSGIKLWKVIPALSWLLVKSFFWRLKEKYIIRDFHPLVFFYLVGLILFPCGLLWGMYLLYLKLFVYGRIAETSALFAVLLIITGLQFLFFAMWFDMEYNKELK